MNVESLLMGTLLIAGVVATSSGVTIRLVERGREMQRFGTVVLAIGGLLLGIFASLT